MNTLSDFQIYLEDPAVTEIFIQGPGNGWIEKNQKIYSLSANLNFGKSEYQTLIQDFCEEAGIVWDLRWPLGNGEWRGHRLHFIAPPLTPEYAKITIRKHPSHSWTLDSLLQKKWCTGSQLELLKEKIRNRSNVLVVGPTGSGKTSVVSALLSETSPEERTILIEDTPELVLPNPLSVSLLSRFDCNQTLKDVSLSELVKQSLRMRPDRIVVGEVRGEEAKDLLLALSTGHRGCLGTLHAESASQALLRLEILIQMGSPHWSLNTIRELIRLGIDDILVLEKKPERRLQAIVKITGLEPTGFLLEDSANFNLPSPYDIEIASNFG